MAYDEILIIGAPEVQNVLISSASMDSIDTIGSSETTKGLSGVNENRLFIYNHDSAKTYEVGNCTSGEKGLFHYSFRGDYTQYTWSEYGEDDPGTIDTFDNQWFVLGNTNTYVFKILNISGTIYIFKTSPFSGGLEIYKKEQYYSDPEDLIDSSCFVLVFNDKKTTVPSWRSVTHFGGNIWMWVKNIGLCYLEGNNLIEVSQPITSSTTSVADSTAGDVVVIADERRKLILCHETTSNNTYVYDAVKKIWQLWTGINVSAQGFGSGDSIFGVEDIAAPVKLGRFARTGDTVTTTVRTPVLDFGYPYAEKFLRRLKIDGQGITEIRIYMRNHKSENFTLYITVSNPSHVTNFYNNYRFRDIIIEIDGDSSFRLDSITPVFDVRRLYEP